MMLIYVIRHGETDWNVEKRLQGQTDIELNANGIRLAENAKESVQKLGITHFYSSPLKRAFVTAGILAGDRASEILSVPELTEYNFGIAEGKTLEERERSQINVAPFFFDTANYIPVEGAETLQEFYDRAESFFKKYIETEKNSNARILVVAHGAMIKMLRLYMYGRPFEKLWDGPFLGNCEAMCFSYENGSYSMVEERINLGGVPDAPKPF